MIDQVTMEKQRPKAKQAPNKKQTTEQQGEVTWVWRKVKQWNDTRLSEGEKMVPRLSVQHLRQIVPPMLQVPIQSKSNAVIQGSHTNHWVISVKIDWAKSYGKTKIVISTSAF